jgi:4'-phosphopantetheinyl transferase
MLHALPDVVPGVELWWTDLAHDATDIERVAAWLSPAEHARAARFGTDLLRRKYIAGRTSLRQALGAALGIEPAAVPIRRGARGRPELDDTVAPLDFNISHTDGGGLIGVARREPADRRRIGVDVEREERLVGADRLARKFLSPAEQASLRGLDADARRRRFLRYWTCKEAMSKATGDGIGAPFGGLTVELAPAPRLVAGPPPYVPDAWRLYAATVPSGFLATVALWRGDDEAVSRR